MQLWWAKDTYFKNINKSYQPHLNGSVKSWNIPKHIFLCSEKMCYDKESLVSLQLCTWQLCNITALNVCWTSFSIAGLSLKAMGI